jgi:tetratricopeptide (TPR) repeat protein
MKKNFVVIILLALGLTWGLFSLPRVTKSKNNKSAVAANRDKKPEISQENEKATATEHSEISVSVKTAISKQKEVFEKALGDKKVLEGLKLAELWASNQFYDSAALVSENLVKVSPNQNNILITADYYYKAYTYALDPEKVNSMGEKTREYYNKALAINPGLLLAKTNMAMTYTTSQTPMQGIMLLREVIAESPDYEPALFNLGLLSMRSNQFAKATERFKHILKNNPTNNQAAFYLGLSYARLGRADEARQSLEPLLKKAIDPTLKVEINNILNELK